MPDLCFAVEKAEVMPYAESPHLVFKLRISNSDAKEKIHSAMLRCQIMIEAAARHYQEKERQNLVDLFGTAEQWNQALHAMFWANTLVMVSSFSGSVTVDVQVPCTFDFNISSTKYYAGLSEGEVPLSFLFSGTVFHDGGANGLRVSQIPWEKEARFQLPVRLWHELMDRYYPNSNWLRISRDNFERLNGYRMKRGLPTCEAALERLLGPERSG